ncbi:MAG: aminoacyl-tRNA hydrolase [Deltaproteobacteria bacterium]|nr:aminoacyl-tRNA hydrolase [Deltaproteobacteria bacterium]
MFLVVGLGNPGKEYELTRHNIGFMAIENLALPENSTGEGRWRKDPTCLWQEVGLKLGEHGAEQGAEKGDDPADLKVILAIPTTFMNKSGIAVKRLVEAFDIEPEKIIIICDDCDLPLGKIRIRKKGGSGGQNGLGSIIKMLGTEDFKRMRLGVGRPSGGAGSKGGESLADFVLTPFASSEAEEVNDELLRATEAVRTIIRDGVEAAMNRFN